MCFCPGAGATQVPVWRLTSFTLPTNLVSGEEGEIQLNVEDIGESGSNGTPVTVVDHLPPGVTATAAGALVNEESAIETPGPWGECGGIGTSTITCTYEAGVIEPVAYFSPGPLLGGGEEEKLEAGQPPAIGIDVSVEPTASGVETNTATASGGGAVSSARATTATDINGKAAAFGASFQQWSTNADGTPDTQAGSHPFEMTTSFFLNTKEVRGGQAVLSGEVKDLHLDLPAGFVGNPNATPKCSREAFDRRLIKSSEPDADCPSDTQVGTLLVRLEPNLASLIPIYNLVPPTGVPSQFGFAFKTLIGFIDGGVNTGSGYEITVDTDNVVQQSIFGVVASLWGDPADPAHDEMRFSPPPNAGHTSGTCRGSGCPGQSRETGERYHIPFAAPAKPLLTLPGRCGAPLELRGSLGSWGTLVEPEVSESFGFDSSDLDGDGVSLSGCERLGFDPSLSFVPESGVAESSVGVETVLRLPQDEDPEGLGSSDLREAVVQLPVGVTVNPSAANGLGACSLEEVGLASAGPVSCPSSSRIGTVEVLTPLLEGPLTGSVFLAQQGNLAGNGSNPFGSLLALYLVVEGDGVLVKLPGEVSLDPGTGRVTARFGEDPVTSASTGSKQFLPQLPFSELRMRLFGGPRASLITPSGCGTYTTGSVLTPWSGGLAAESSSSFTIGSGCSSGFAPAFSAGTLSNQAGGFGAFSVTFSRKDGEQRFGGAQVTTPPGLLGVLKSVARCGEPQASEGTCAPESQIGEATVASGAGEDPYWVKGAKVYLTGPYEGAPFGLSIVVPTSAGPFTLRGNEGPGKEVVRSAITVDPHTAQITVTSDPLPTMLEGVPLDIKTVDVTVNRPGFMVNPTDCSPLAVSGTLASTTGTTVPVASPFEAVNCANLPFKPSLSASTQGKTSKTDGASLDVKIGYLPGQANLAKLKTDLPLQLPSRLTTLQKSCAQAAFQANPASCPPYSFVGTVTAVTPLLASPLTGPAILVNHGGAQLPNLVFVLQAEGITVEVEGITHVVKGITSETFQTLPDAPISSFQAILPEGPHSILAANGNLCTSQSKLNMPTAFTAQNGATLKQTTKITVTNCPKPHTQNAKAHVQSK
jgi:hypothetical protein